MNAPEDLVATYAKEVEDFERRPPKDVLDVPSGRAILKLSDEERARAVVAAYRALPTTGSRYGERIMLGVLITTLLKKKLSFTPEDFLVMAEHAARAWQPSLGPCDYDHALVKLLQKAKLEVDAKMKKALVDLAERRGRKYALDRKIGDACLALSKA